MRLPGRKPKPARVVVAPGPVVIDEAVLAPLLSALPADVRDRAWAARRPAAALTVHALDGAVAAIGASRFGGLPDLPDDLEWPAWDGPGGAWEHRLLTFYGQVDLAGVAGHLDLVLPPDGLLLFFVDFDQRTGGRIVTGLYDDEHAGSRVLYVPTGTPLQRRTPPRPVQVHRDALVTPILTQTLPRGDALDLDDDLFEAYDEVDSALLAHLDEACAPGYHVSGLHQLGGFARPIQEAVEGDAVHAAYGLANRAGTGHDSARWEEVRSEQAEWTLLLQLASDDELDWMFGDVGTLYWVAPRDDLARAEWGTTRFVFQC